MKKLIAVVMLVMVLTEVSRTQNVNWRTLRQDQRNVIQFNFGYDFGVTSQFGYSRSFTMFRPVILGVDVSVPMGNDLIDDFKVRVGGQIEIVQIGGFSATVKVYSNFRRYQTQLVRIVSFGSDFAAIAGYYKRTWHAAGEFGFDKSVTSHLKHSDVMRTYFPAIKDGWYLPSGGHFYYGIQAGKTIGDSFDLALRVGATNAQDDDESALVPYYVQLGLGVRF